MRKKRQAPTSEKGIEFALRVHNREADVSATKDLIQLLPKVPRREGAEMGRLRLNQRLHLLNEVGSWFGIGHAACRKRERAKQRTGCKL